MMKEEEEEEGRRSFRRLLLLTGTAVHAQHLAAHVVLGRFHYRADVLLRLLDPLHLREVRNSRGPAESVLVFYLPDTVWKVQSRSVRGTMAPSIKTHSRNKKKRGLIHTFFCPEK